MSDFGVQFDLGSDDVRVQMDKDVYFVRVVERGESLLGAGVSGLEGIAVAGIVALVSLARRRRTPKPEQWTVGVVRLDGGGAGRVRVICRERGLSRADALRRVAELADDVRRGDLR